MRCYTSSNGGVGTTPPWYDAVIYNRILWFLGVESHLGVQESGIYGSSTGAVGIVWGKWYKYGPALIR